MFVFMLYLNHTIILLYSQQQLIFDSVIFFTFNLNGLPIAQS